MKKIKNVLMVLFIIAALSSLLSCDLLIDIIFGETEEVEHTIAIDVNETYFDELGSDSIDIYINGTYEGTISKEDLDSSWEYSQFTFNYSDSLSSIRIACDSGSDTFDSLSDFDSDQPDEVSFMSDIMKIVLVPDESEANLSGAYIGPVIPSFSIIDGSETFASVDIEVTEKEAPDNLSFNIYLSTDAGSSYTKHNATSISASDMYGSYTVEDLELDTDYLIRLESVYSDLSSDTSSSESFSTVDGNRWTVMVWLDGDNNLNEAAVIDFHEMEHGLYLAQQSDSDITDKLSIIVQYDQNPTHDNSSSVPGRYEVLPNATENSQYIAPSSTSTLLESLTEPNMGSAEELADFIDYAKEYYPAQHYALILWNHGGGVRSAEEEGELTKAICWDDTDGDDALYIGEIKDYLDSSHSVDFLGMDACLMGFVEVAYEFRPDTGDFGSDAITFSPASEQGDGWEYDAIFSRLSGQSGSDSDGHSYYSIDTLSANQFATVAAQEYEDAWSSDSWETQTAVDLTQIADVKSAADDFAGTIKDYQTQVETIRGAVGTGSLMAYFDESETSEWYSYAGFDLYELAEQVKANSEVTSIDNAADDLMDAIDDAVLYSFAQSSYDAYGTGFEEGKNGLAIFFPDGDEDYGSYPYWAYQHWYNGASHSEYASWWGSPDSPDYGALDFCTSDGDGTVESWFELLQYWFNDSDDDPNPYNPSPKE